MFNMRYVERPDIQYISRHNLIVIPTELWNQTVKNSESWPETMNKNHSISIVFDSNKDYLSEENCQTKPYLTSFKKRKQCIYKWSLEKVRSMKRFFASFEAAWILHVRVLWVSGSERRRVCNLWRPADFQETFERLIPREKSRGGKTAVLSFGEWSRKDCQKR